MRRVLDDDSRALVYAVEDGKAEQRLVELGATLADGIVIRQGVSAEKKLSSRDKPI